MLYCLLALIHTVQERDDLCTGAATVRAEQAAADTVGNAIVNRPLDRTCVICVRVYISEIAVAGSGICLGCARQERYAVCARTGLIRAKGGIGRTLGSGEPAARHRKVTICARVQDWFGANRLSPIPPVIPLSAAHLTAS